MTTCKGSTLAAAALALGLLTAPAPSDATTIDLFSGQNIRHELFRTNRFDGQPCPEFPNRDGCTWATGLAFAFELPDTAIDDGIFRMFAGGDLNNIGSDTIAVFASVFGTTLSKDLGVFAFPVDGINCENPPHTNPAGCPVPETVPGGLYQDLTRGVVADVQGRDVKSGMLGLVVPKELLVGARAHPGSILSITLFPRDPIFDLYIDRLVLSYPVPEPSTWSLLAVGLGVLLSRVAARSRRVH